MKFRARVGSAILATGLLFGAMGANAKAEFDPQQKQAIEQIVHQYLVKNPEVLMEVSKALQLKQREDMMKQAESAIGTNGPALFDSSSPMVGNKLGNVTMVEFFDYQCIHCKQMAPVVSELVKKDGGLRIVYKEFPIFGKSSEFAAQAALASQSQGKYLAFHDALMAAKERLSPKLVMKIAASVGIDTSKLKTDMKSAKVTKELKDTRQLAESLRLMGTPAFIIAKTPKGKYKQGAKSFFVPGASSEDALQSLIKQANG